MNESLQLVTTAHLHGGPGGTHLPGNGQPETCTPPGAAGLIVDNVVK